MTGLAINMVISFCLKCGIQSKAEGDERLGMHSDYSPSLLVGIKQMKRPEKNNTALKSILLCSQHIYKNR